ncbi:hypothetical protein QE377_002084 [Microbacterium sp. SORGH_AS 862]|nr:hypothetical protein [Microbacterium sp. SORGH_AS_0862]
MTNAPDSHVDDTSLEDARRAFSEARRAWEASREHLLRTHIETARLWSGAS